MNANFFRAIAVTIQELCAMFALALGYPDVAICAALFAIITQLQMLNPVIIQLQMKGGDQ